MITLSINEKEYHINNGYKELSLGQYVDILKVGDSKINLDGNEAEIAIIAALSDKPEELKVALLDLTIEEFSELVSHFDWVKDVSILEEFKSMDTKKVLNIDDVEYGVMVDYNKMSLGEIVTFETLLKQENSDFHRLELAFGVLLRPLVDGKIVKFSEEVFLEVVKNKYKVKVLDIYALISFFLSGEKTSTTKNTKRFSVRTQ